LAKRLSLEPGMGDYTLSFRHVDPSDSTPIPFELSPKFGAGYYMPVREAIRILLTYSTSDSVSIEEILQLDFAIKKIGITLW